MTSEIKAYIHGAIDAKLRSLEIKKPLLITRPELIKQAGRDKVDKAEEKGQLHRIKGEGRTATVRYRYSEVEAWLDTLSEE